MRFFIAYIDKGNCEIESKRIEAKTIRYALGRAAEYVPRDTDKITLQKIEDEKSDAEKA